MKLDREQRIAQAQQAYEEGRIIQHSWRKSGGEGRELVCALAAFGNDINSPGDCPADLMPDWVAHLIPAIDDGIAVEKVPWLMGQLLDRAKKWHKLTPDAWQRIQTGFLIATLRLSIEKAQAVQPSPAPAYWTQVVAAQKQVEKALESGDLEALKEAEAAARAAARAAEAAAARAAAWAAARAAEAAAARAAARAAEAAAARAAAEAAAWAAEAAAEAAAWAAEAAAWVEIAELLFKFIDAELDLCDVLY